MKNYEIMRDGRVWSNKSNKYLTPSIHSKTGYVRYNLDGKTYLAHRLVAQTYLPNPQNLPCVNHKDHNRQNNNVENLEWCSYEYNNNYSKCIEAMAKSHKKRVAQYSLNGELISVWDSCADAGRALGLKNVYQAANGSRKTVGGFKWKYLQ